MNRGTGAAAARKRGRTQVRRALLFIVIGLLLASSGPLYAFIATNFSGRLVLRQGISAADLVRGFEFGPVYLAEAEGCRYFISALLPETPEGVWHTTFEVTDSTGREVFRQDELRFSGEYQFQPGQRDTYSKVFRLADGPGYYYFRYKAVNGRFEANPDAPPVVEFSVRQSVISDGALWIPAFAVTTLGLLVALLGILLLYRVSSLKPSKEREADPQRGEGRRLGRRSLEPAP